MHSPSRSLRSSSDWRISSELLSNPRLVYRFSVRFRTHIINLIRINCLHESNHDLHPGDSRQYNAFSETRDRFSAIFVAGNLVGEKCCGGFVAGDVFVILLLNKQVSYYIPLEYFFFNVYNSYVLKALLNSK